MGSGAVIGLLVRIIVSVAVLAGLLYVLPARQVAAAIRQVPPALWAVAFVVFLLGHVVAALKWRLLIPSSVEVPAGAAVRAHFGGLAANLFLPGLVGGDVVRAAWLGRSVGGWEGVAVAGLVGATYAGIQKHIAELCLGDLPRTGVRPLRANAKRGAIRSHRLIEQPQTYVTAGAQALVHEDIPEQSAYCFELFVVFE